MEWIEPGPGLKATLLDLAEVRIEQIGHEKLSLRALAAEAGVAPSAPYRHFPDRAALLMALRERGLAYLTQSHNAAAAIAGAPPVRLRAAIDGFMEFAARRPQLYQLMFTSETLRDAPLSGPGRQSFSVFESIVAQVCLPGEASAQVHSLSLWSAMHGAAMLHLHGRMPDEGAHGQLLSAVIRDIALRYGAT